MLLGSEAFQVATTFWEQILDYMPVKVMIVLRTVHLEAFGFEALSLRDQLAVRVPSETPLKDL